MNTPIRIIDSNFNLLGEIDDYESLIFIRRFYKVGEFELHININKNNVEMLQEDNLIILGNACNKVGIIRHRENAYDQNGELTDTLVIKGPTLKGLCNRRLIVPPTTQAYDSFEGFQEAIMKYFVDKNCINPVDDNRAIANLILAKNLNRGEKDIWRGRFENLSDKLTEIGEYSKIGWDVSLDFDINKFVFDVIEGKNLIANQDILPPIIFSLNFENLKSRHYIDSAINYKNVAYIGGKGENEDRLIQEIGQVNGFSRLETFLDCSNAEDIIQLKQIGKQKLDELKKVKSFEVQIIPYGSFNYEKDYDLGDTVTIQDRKLNLTMDTQIIEFKEIYEVGGFNLEATFGTNIPTILDEIKKLEQQKLVEAKTGTAGTDGKDGAGLQFSWNGSQLGVKKETEDNYNYVNLQGLKGDIGLTGVQGMQGVKGDTGATGAKGDQGIQGIQGLKGDKGDKGEKGDTGECGLQGLKGEQGERGIQGLTGLQGIQGVQGPIGLTTAIKLGSTQYNQNGGTISLPAYPTALPASGGNADTVGGKQASDFLMHGSTVRIDSQDLNDLRNTGFYSIAMCANSPARYGWCIVMKWQSNNETCQLFIPALGISSNLMYFRISDNSTNWSAWKEFSFTDHMHTKSNITDFPSSLPANGGNADTLQGKYASDFAKEYQATVPNISNANYTTIAHVTGSGLNSKIRLTIGGTTGCVVVSIIADIIVNHHCDIYIKSQSGSYTQVTLKILSDSNDNFWIQAKTSSPNLGALNCRIYALGGETVTMYTNNPTASGSCVLEHDCRLAGMSISSVGGDATAIDINGNIVWHSGNLAKLSQLQNDIGAGGGTNIVTSSAEPTKLKAGEWWYKE